MPWDVKENTIRHRVKDPGEFQQNSFITKEMGQSGIQAVMGRLKGERTLTIQALIFPKDKFSVDEAKAWVAKHPEMKGSEKEFEKGAMCFMYDSWESAPAYVKRHGQVAAEKWVKLVREKFAESKDEYAALKAANSAMGFEERADRWNIAGSRRAFVEIWPSFTPAGYYEVEFCHTGDWIHPEYGPITHSFSDLKDAVRNFRDEPRVSPLDYIHGTDYGVTHDQAIAAGVLDDVWITDEAGKNIIDSETYDEFARLMTRWKLTARANEYLQAGEYIGFSPTYHPNFSDKKTGKKQGFTILAGALTNRPWFDGQKPGVLIAASERAAKWIKAAELRPGARFCIVCTKDGGTIEDQVAALSALGFDIDTFYQGMPAQPASYQDHGHRGAGGSESRSDVGDPSKMKQGSQTKEGTMPRTAEERVHLAKTLKMAETVTDAELDEKLASLVALAEKAPKPGDVVVAAEKLKDLEAKANRGDEAFKNAYAEKRTAVIQGAIDDFKIRKADEKKWTDQYDRDPIATKELLDGLMPNAAFSGAEKGHGGENGPGASPAGASSKTMAEIERLADEKVKANPKLNRVTARNQVFSEKPELYEHYRRETTRGGDR